MTALARAEERAERLVLVDGLVVRFGEVEAVAGVSFDVGGGEVFGLLGPNGAGKTTTIRVLTTLLRPTEGSAFVAGHDVVREGLAVRQAIGYVPQDSGIDQNGTGRENLMLQGRVQGMGGRELRDRVSELLEFVGIADAADRVVKTYSGGMRRRLDLASALTGNPRILFLDEPTTGLDPRGRLGMWDVIRGLVREGVTLLLTTQYLEEADALANTIAVVDRGRIIARGTSDELKAQVGGERIEVVVHSRADIARAIGVLASDGDGEHTIDEHMRKITVPAKGGAHRLAQVVRELDDAQITIDDIGLRRPTLDDVFLTLTGHAAELTAPVGASGDR